MPSGSAFSQPPEVPLPLEEQLCYAIYSTAIAIQRLYKPLLDAFGLTYPQFLVLNVLWRDRESTVGGLAEALALESSTLTPLLKRLETAGFVRRIRNPRNERQVVISLTPPGLALQARASCLGKALAEASGQGPDDLVRLNLEIRQLRDSIYASLD